MASPPVQPAAGWYADPRQAGGLRWWDGQQWTEHIHIYAPQPPPAHVTDPTLRWVVPIGRSGLAVAAGYLGLFAVLFIPAPLALGFGIWALVDIRRNPTKLGRGRAIFAIVMGGLFTILLALSLIPALR